MRDVTSSAAFSLIALAFSTAAIGSSRADGGGVVPHLLDVGQARLGGVELGGVHPLRELLHRRERGDLLLDGLDGGRDGGLDVRPRFVYSSFLALAALMASVALPGMAWAAARAAA